MACDEILYRQYLDGDDAGLDALMKEYGDPPVSLPAWAMESTPRS